MSKETKEQEKEAVDQSRAKEQETQVMDEAKIEEVVDEPSEPTLEDQLAEQKDILVSFGLTRKKLSLAINKKPRMSVVGILNPDGTNITGTK